MEQKELKNLLSQVAEGVVSVDEALLKFKTMPFDDIGFAKIDNHRAVRQGIAEVIYGSGKTSAQIEAIAKTMLDNGQKTVIITRLDAKKAEDISKNLPITYYETGRIGIAGTMPDPDTDTNIVVATGGTSDIPVAEEAALTAEALGNRVIRLYDVGVAGIHRLFAYAEDIMSARAIIAVAGMEGALASVIGGIADCPVIAVPTSVGYGASFGGISALLSMLNSCAGGISVVNIDNGFGAGYLASMINHI
ncbi:MAG: nickel pincer cofactor biosynthesis protein LarB [Clostridia bacterium]|nr:nickel pincer cofactor biosynthesis protein LarB [Clostridia bacterium]